MKLFLRSVLLAVFSGSFCFAQVQQEIDSLKHELFIAKHDTNRVLILVELAAHYQNNNTDSALIFGQRALDVGKKIKFLRGQARAFHRLGSTYRVIGELPKALTLMYNSLQITEENHFYFESARCLNLLGVLFLDLNEKLKATNCLLQALKLNLMVGNSKEKVNQSMLILTNLVNAYRERNLLDSATHYLRKVENFGQKYNVRPSSPVLSSISQIEFLLGHHQKAMEYSHKAIQLCKQNNDHRTAGLVYYTFATYLKDLNQPDSAIYYLKKGLAESQSIDFKNGVLRNSRLLAELYESRDIQKAYEYQKIATKTNEEIYGAKKIQALQKTIVDELDRQRQMEAERVTYQNQLKQYALLAGLAGSLLIGFILYLNNRQKQKANKILGDTLTELKVTQVQLENKNRDLEIEAALERVRSRTMAMQKSDELTEVAGVLFKQVTDMGVKLWTAGFNVWSEDNNSYVDYLTSPFGGFAEPYTVNATEFSVFVEISEAKKRGEEFLVQYLDGDLIKQLYLKLSGDETQYEKMLQDGFQFPSHQYNHFVFGAKVSLMFITYEPVPEIHDIFKRFGKVFEQTYTRFLDLQKAEAQARESQIQLAMERVRARTMVMQTTDNLTNEDLKDAAALLFQQVKALGVPAYSCGYNIWEQGEQECDAWMSTHDGSGINPAFKIPLTEESNFIDFVESKKNNESFYVVEMRGERMQEYYQYLIKTIPVFKSYFEEVVKAGFPMPETQIHHIANFSYGNLMFITLEPCPEFHDVFKRFAAVFEQTYTRFLELKKAETQAREAKIEAALERIRSRAMAMNTSEELNTLIGFIYAECTKLNMLLDRGFIMTFDKATKDAHWWMVSADASDMPLKVLVKYHEYTPNLAILKGWEQREQRWSYVLEGNNKKTWDDYQFANALSQLPDSVKHNMRSVKSVILNASFQNFGCIMLSSFEPLSDNHFELLMRLSKVIDLTYTRFLDLHLKEQNAIRLVEEKHKLEHTLAELRTTQAQLIQKEKLASLGELTAGIAHEIQNPLNFVNNFSELSVDLAQELNEELDKEPIDKVFVKELMGDLTQNQSKINLHGKRASSIVKGMLEHSRQSSGERELTDLNQLADEYLRLSYHGLRAKDSSFNCDYELIADSNLPKIEVIPQDIGRVLLNLINNAFYAVNVGRVQKAADVSYSPKVIVSTQNLGTQIVIEVKDNGTGMSDATKAKIFQPFFTTKPTGEGTGLGLSLAYDIVTKGHGGTIEVESVEGEGTTFTMRFPKR